ncbi:MAG: RNA polymerase sigma-70 factor [Odoribacteraceae bacterium]|jgi:RNA polymerase sigma-70 factor (ECF subfamily)|nr:RNA polymerase sigma-70 factor [Odoribacteraceae bacterium]
MDKGETDELINEIREGKEEAFATVFHLYYKPLLSYAYRILRDPELANDTVQGAFCHFYEHRARISITLSIKSYLYKTVYNACLDAIKHRKVQHNYVNQQLLDFYFSKIVQTPEAEMALYNESIGEELRKAIDRLPARCREIFVLSKYDGLSNKQIAEQLNISEKTVEAQMTNAFSRLRKDLEWLLCLILFSQV